MGYSLRSDRMELPKDSEDESERHVFRQVEAVTALRFRLPCCCVNFRPKSCMFRIFELAKRSGFRSYDSANVTMN
jgi:hypothetical protein